MHVAIIMDGNGRWATQRGLPRTAGHVEGAKAVRAAVEVAARAGIDTLTLYAFSAANWARPAAEISALMRLFGQYLFTETRRCVEQSIRINVIGRRDRLSDEPAALDRAERAAERRRHGDAAAHRGRLLVPAQHRRGGAPGRRIVADLDHRGVSAPAARSRSFACIRRARSIC